MILTSDVFNSSVGDPAIGFVGSGGAPCALYMRGEMSLEDVQSGKEGYGMQGRHTTPESFGVQALQSASHEIWIYHHCSAVHSLTALAFVSSMSEPLHHTVTTSTILLYMVSRTGHTLLWLIASGLFHIHLSLQQSTVHCIAASAGLRAQEENWSCIQGQPSGSLRLWERDRLSIAWGPELCPWSVPARSPGHYHLH